MTPAENANPNIYQIRMHRWRMAFFALVILLAGITIGVSAALLTKWQLIGRPQPGPEHIAGRMIEGIEADLLLSPEQREKIGPIIRSHMERIDQIRQDARPLIEQEMQKMNDEILPILTEEQKVRWTQMLHRLPLERAGGGAPLRHPPQRFGQESSPPGPEAPMPEAPTSPPVRRKPPGPDSPP